MATKKLGEDKKNGHDQLTFPPPHASVTANPSAYLMSMAAPKTAMHGSIRSLNPYGARIGPLSLLAILKLFIPLGATLTTHLRAASYTI